MSPTPPDVAADTAAWYGRELNRHAARANQAHEQLARVEGQLVALVASWREHAAKARARIERSHDPLCDDTDTAADVACADAFTDCADELARIVDGEDLASAAPDEAPAMRRPCCAVCGTRFIPMPESAARALENVSARCIGCSERAG